MLRAIGKHGFAPDATACIGQLDLPPDAPLAQALLGGQTIVADEAEIEKLLPPAVRQDLAAGFLLVVPLNVGGRVMGGCRFCGIGADGHSARPRFSWPKASAGMSRWPSVLPICTGSNRRPPPFREHWLALGGR